MAIMFGGEGAEVKESDDSTKIYKTWSVASLGLTEEQKQTKPTTLPYGTKTITTPAKAEFYNQKGEKVDSWGDTVAYITAEISATEMGVIEISAGTFPGTYYVTGDTYARSETTGQDEFFQFIIPKAKMNSENTITLEAEGDPSVFNMSLRVMRPADGKMMKLVKYDVTEGTTGTTEQQQEPQG